MGDRLWISASTGYRRRRTCLAEFSRSPGCWDYGTSSAGTSESCPADASAGAVVGFLRQKHFGLAGVQGHPDSPIHGYSEEGSLY